MAFLWLVCVGNEVVAALAAIAYSVTSKRPLERAVFIPGHSACVILRTAFGSKILILVRSPTGSGLRQQVAAPQSGFFYYAYYRQEVSIDIEFRERHEPSTVLCTSIPDTQRSGGSPDSSGLLRERTGSFSLPCSPYGQQGWAGHAGVRGPTVSLA